MKKILSSIIAIIGIISLGAGFGSKVLAVDVPIYDATFNNNSGALYANGTPITINEDSSGNTVVTWEGGSQTVPETVYIFGGGKEGTSYISSNITMEDGTVRHIYGGGVSLTEKNPAKVGTSNITVNGGNITSTLYGGGLIYSEVDNSNVTINGDSTIQSIVGGGSAATSISGVTYSAGTEDDMENSKNRTNNTNITINSNTQVESVFGGGQGYSYVGNANVTVNGGNNGYITSGGSNGYTKNATTTITGGNAQVLQTINRGIVENADIKVAGGNIRSAYVGGETEDPTVDGLINNINFNIIGGMVETLNKGTSGGTEISIDQDDYKVAYVTESVKKSNLNGKEVVINYGLNIVEDGLDLFVNQTGKLNAVITTTPAGYEKLFNVNDVVWTSQDPDIVVVRLNGEVTGVSNGNTTITASLNNKTDTAEVTVRETPIYIPIIILAILGILALILWFINLILR